MSLSEKSRSVMSKIEILIAVVLFFVMLITCGLYIDVKLNGKTSNLPSLSDNDKKMLLLSSASDSISFVDDLLEPTFIGFRQDGEMFAVLPYEEIRRTVEGNVYETIELLFSGENKKVEFKSQNELEGYIERIKYGRTYMLIGFFGDLPSSVILPCVLSDYKVDTNKEAFLFKYLFILPDQDGNVYGCAVSENLDVYELIPKNTVRFDKILNETYDIRDGFAEFEYLDASILSPVLISSFEVEDVFVESCAKIQGKDGNNSWISNLFDVFSFNSNLVRNFISGDGSEINYVEESHELVVNDSGIVEFKTTDSIGIPLNEFLGSNSEINDNITFSDKIFALKNVINRICDDENGISYSLVGVNYDNEADSLKVYFKYMAGGVFIFNSNYDAVFEIKGNSLVYARFMAVKCGGIDTFSTVMPQKYASISHDFSETFLFMYEDENGKRSAKWANSSASAEVNE